MVNGTTRSTFNQTRREPLVAVTIRKPDGPGDITPNRVRMIARADSVSPPESLSKLLHVSHSATLDELASNLQAIGRVCSDTHP